MQLRIALRPLDGATAHAERGHPRGLEREDFTVEKVYFESCPALRTGTALPPPHAGAAPRALSATTLGGCALDGASAEAEMKKQSRAAAKARGRWTQHFPIARRATPAHGHRRFQHDMLGNCARSRSSSRGGAQIREAALRPNRRSIKPTYREWAVLESRYRLGLEDQRISPIPAMASTSPAE